MRATVSFSLLLLTDLLANVWAEDTPVDITQVKRGEYLAIAVDCTAYHMTPGDKSFTGDLPMQIPMLGTIHSSNITPDERVGIGKWTYEEFGCVMREGVDDDDSDLYPAMPYSSYAEINDADMRDLCTYFHDGVTVVGDRRLRGTIH